MFPKFEKPNKLNINVSELTKSVLKPIHINTKYTEPQTDLMLSEIHNCPINKLHSFINKDPHMKHVYRKCKTAFRSYELLNDHKERCSKQKPANIGFTYEDKTMFEDHQMKVQLQFGVYADFECINQPHHKPDHQDILHKQLPIAMGYYLISQFGKENKSCFDEECIHWFVKEMLELQTTSCGYNKGNLELQRAPEGKAHFQHTTKCWLCEQPFQQEPNQHKTMCLK